VAPHLECNISIDQVKIGLGAKTATGAKLRGQFCSFFLRAKIATLKKLGG